MKLNSRLLLLAAVTALGGTGCGKVSLSLDNVLPNLPSIGFVQLSNGAEFVASSQQSQKTVNSYSVNSSAGSAFSQLLATTPNGYKVYSTVQGQLASESEETTTE